jgi:hypothetical protein
MTLRKSSCGGLVWTRELPVAILHHEHIDYVYTFQSETINGLVCNDRYDRWISSERQD